jgi:hypothetical protein
LGGCGLRHNDRMRHNDKMRYDDKMRHDDKKNRHAGEGRYLLQATSVVFRAECPLGQH